MNQQTPGVPLHDPNFKWIPSWMTDVQATWRKFGWVPPTESRK